MKQENTDEIMQKLTTLGFSKDMKICFEPLSVVDLTWFAHVDTRTKYLLAMQAYTRHVLEQFAERGVIFTSLDGVVISPFAKIGVGTVIHAGTQIRHGVTIGAHCEIGPNSVIENSTVGDQCMVNATQIYDSILEDQVKIGPFCHVRPNSRLCTGVKIGDFVEVKNSTVGASTHASHLTYIGDSDVGKRVNFGCGVVTVNYDGSKKARTVIGDDAFIGCNSTLVAPVQIGNGAYTAAGSTITENVPSEALGIARARQINKEKWVWKKKQKEQKQ